MIHAQTSLAEQLLNTMQNLIHVLDQEEEHLNTQDFDSFAETVVQKEKLCQDMRQQLEHYASIHNTPMEKTLQETAPLLRKKLIRNQRKLKNRIRFQKLMIRIFTECLSGTVAAETYSPQGKTNTEATSISFHQKA